MPNENTPGADPQPEKKTGEVLGENQKTQPDEHLMEKASTPEPEKNAYAPSPPLAGTITATHDRDSVQPGPEPKGQYAPEAKLADGSDAPTPSER